MTACNTGLWKSYQPKLELMYLNACAQLKVTPGSALLQYQLGNYLDRNSSKVEEAKLVNPFSILEFLDSKDAVYKKEDNILHMQELKVALIMKELQKASTCCTETEAKTLIEEDITRGIRYIDRLKVLRSEITSYMNVIISFRREIENFLLTYDEIKPAELPSLD